MNDNKYFLGITAFAHGSSVAIIGPSGLIYAAEEERFSRKKNDCAFPSQAIKSALAQCKISADQIHSIGFYEQPLYKALRTLAMPSLVGFPNGFLEWKVWLARVGNSLINAVLTKRKIIKELSKISRSFNSKKIYFFDHHLSHASVAQSSATWDDGCVLVMDAVGEFITTSVWSTLSNGKLNKVWSSNLPHSIGMFYSTITQYCGFKVDSGEYKMMGLAPFGRPIFKDLLKALIKFDGSVLVVDKKYYGWMYGSKMYSSELVKLLAKPPRYSDDQFSDYYCDLASSCQAQTEDLIESLVDFALEITGKTKISLAGGVAMNCVANGKLAKKFGSKNINIFLAPTDAGSSVGAAILAKQNLNGVLPKIELKNSSDAYLGPSFRVDEIKTRLEELGIKYSTHSDSEILLKCASAISDGHVLGVFRGRMEFGQRALGARSIIADPRGIKTQSRINLKIKFREGFRPFAPVILKEDLSKYFDVCSETDSPFMQYVVPFKKAIRLNENQMISHKKNYLKKLNIERSEFSSITHVDYSARVQTVDENNFLGQLLNLCKASYSLPMLVNTSFNRRGEPIVCSPDDALGCFFSTDIDGLAIENFYISKKENSMLQNADIFKRTFLDD
jgi:carbamoyltransferase